MGLGHSEEGSFPKFNHTTRLLRNLQLEITRAKPNGRKTKTNASSLDGNSCSGASKTELLPTWCTSGDWVDRITDPEAKTTGRLGCEKPGF